MDDVTRRVIGDAEFPVVVGHEALRRTARDWRRYSSDTPFRVPIPEESALRPVRQYPIETDPPDHTAYRSLIAHRFSRSAAESIEPGLRALVDDLLAAAVSRGELEVVDQFAIPVVTAAIAATMGRPQDAARFASWGLHVFRDPSNGQRRANDDLDAYLVERVDEALAAPGDDLFGELARAEFSGRPLTRDELLGYGYLVLAGGRDTVIASICGALGHLATRPEARRWLRDDATRIPVAVEEFLRFFSPLGTIARTATEDHDLDGIHVATGERVALGFADANHDPTVFDRPAELQLDRRPNRHVAFGHGPHTCIGAPLARMELAVVVERFAGVGRAEVIAPVGWQPGPGDERATGAHVPLDLVIAL